MATHRYRSWIFPGIEYHNRQYTSGLTVWSLEVALWIPLSFLAVVHGDLLATAAAICPVNCSCRHLGSKLRQFSLARTSKTSV